MRRHEFRPRLDLLEPRMALSAAAAIDPRDPIDAPPHTAEPWWYWQEPVLLPPPTPGGPIVA